MTYEEAEKLFPINAKVRIKNPLPKFPSSKNHIVQSCLGKMGIVTKINKSSKSHDANISIIFEGKILSYWFYPEWIEILNKKEELVEEDYDTIFKRKRDENLRSMFC